MDTILLRVGSDHVTVSGQPDGSINIRETKPSYEQFDPGTRLHNDGTNGLTLTNADTDYAFQNDWDAAIYDANNQAICVAINEDSAATITIKVYVSMDLIDWFKWDTEFSITHGAGTADWTRDLVARKLGIYARYMRFYARSSVAGTKVKLFVTGRP